MVRIPRTAPRASAQVFARLLIHVDPTVRIGGFEGTLIQPGRYVAESALRPTPQHPAVPVLLECAGQSGRGHNRGDSLWLLWRYHSGEWIEIARAYAPDWTWANDLRPIAIRALGQEKTVETPKLEQKASRVIVAIDRQIRELGHEQQHQVLCVVERQLAARMVAIEASTRCA